MMNTQEFADAIGRKNMADSLGVGLTAISNAVVRGAFPASWFLVSRELAKKAGVDFPAYLFSQKRSDSHESLSSDASLSKAS